jgi:hypothetical protein
MALLTRSANLLETLAARAEVADAACRAAGKPAVFGVEILLAAYMLARKLREADAA